MPKTSEITAISLFSGAGGDTLGMKNAGINVIGYIEWDRNSIETHKQNFPECKLIGKDITKIEDEGVDIIFGGFPCQSFLTEERKRLQMKEDFYIKSLLERRKLLDQSLL